MNSSEIRFENRVPYILARVNAGLASEWSQIADLAGSLERMLKDAHALGEPHVPADRRSDWDQAWRDLREAFDRVRALDAEAQKRFTSSNPSSDPLEPWRNILECEEDFTNSLTAIRLVGAESISVGDRSLWDDLCQDIERRLATLNAHALAVRFQLELREKYGRQKADALTREIAQRLPRDTSIGDAEKYAEEYRKASEEFEREKETFGGAWDLLKGLMLVQPKTPADRVLEKHPERLRRSTI